jgi:hypothetical protein
MADDTVPPWPLPDHLGPPAAGAADPGRGSRTAAGLCRRTLDEPLPPRRSLSATACSALCTCSSIPRRSRANCARSLPSECRASSDRPLPRIPSLNRANLGSPVAGRAAEQ